MGWLSILPFGEFIVGELSKWSQRRDAIKQAQTDAQIAELKAKAEIAAYKVKADIEWDLKWADQAGSSWKDEFMLLLWSFPLIGLFIPGIRPYVMEGFDYLKLFNDEAGYWYMAGWAIIFAATFGFKQAAQFMLPGQAANLATVLSGIPDDVPEYVAGKAQSAIDKLLKAKP